MANRQAIAGGFPFPVYVNETAKKQRIATGGLYVNETSPPPSSSTRLLLLLGVGG